MNAERHYLTSLFEPTSIAIIGASDAKNSSAVTLARNIVDSGYEGKLFFVNSQQKKVFGHETYPSVENIPQRLDLAVICSPASALAETIDACGRAGCRNAIVITGGFNERGSRGAIQQRTILENARHHGMRLLGPNCAGILRPGSNIHLANVQSDAYPGTIGLISQSGAFCAAFLDWAYPNKVGFSNVVSLGSEGDIDFGEVLDYMASDPRTENIFMYVEDIKNARRFMSALRTAARCKPVLLIKVGRYGISRRALHAQDDQLQTDLPLGADDVFDAALRRAGVVRLTCVGQMYAAAAALFSHFRPRGNRLAIITNGGGPGVMAADHARDIRIPMATFEPKTIAQLTASLPPTWSISNPIDILGDADPERYCTALRACLDDDNVDGVLTLFTPQAKATATQTAKAVIEVAKTTNKPIVTCWMGGDQVREARLILQDAGLPSFHTPEPAVDLFSHVSHYYLNRRLLQQTPPSISETEPPRLESARLVIETALMEGRKTLSEMESKAVLASFKIPIAATAIARSASEAMVLAEVIGLPVVMKVDSPQIRHKSDIGGVCLNVDSPAAVRDTWLKITESVKRHQPDAVINGIAIEPMIAKTNGRDLFVGIVRDKVFGPIVVFGPGGSGVKVDNEERAVALPPLNSILVTDMLAYTSKSAGLGEFRNMPPVNMEALEAVLLRVSEMACELPWISELSINPLIVDENGAVAVDACIVIENLSLTAGRYDHMAIHPYPSHLITSFQGKEGMQITVRPIRPEDAALKQQFVQALTPEARYMRFMNSIQELSPAQLIRLTQIDYHREMAFIATIEANGEEIAIGDARYATNPDGDSCEFAIAVATEWQGKGLARRMMGTLIDAARSRGLKYMNGDFLADNSRMLAFVNSLGFVLTAHPDDPGLKRGVLTLN